MTKTLVITVHHSYVPSLYYYTVQMSSSNTSSQTDISAKDKDYDNNNDNDNDNNKEPTPMFVVPPFLKDYQNKSTLPPQKSTNNCTLSMSATCNK